MTAPSTNPLHLLRALLRECTYLPDPNARRYFHGHIIQTYRNYVPEIKEWRKDIPLARQVSLLRRGRQTLSLLRHANDGYVKPLHKVLSMSYGRSGRRRRELMEKLLAPETPQNHEALAHVEMEAKYSRTWRPPAQLSALLRSQSEQVKYLGENKRRIKSKVVIPETNLWGKPMPKSRVKNITRKWYAKQTNHVFPPLPENEREDLRSLASGEHQWCPVLRRAKLGQPSTMELLEQNLQHIILGGPQKGHTFQAYVDGRPHELTDRFMRRLWCYIYKHVPSMTYYPETRRWRVYWHDVSRKKSALGQVVPKIQETLLFGHAEPAHERSSVDAIVACSTA